MERKFIWEMDYGNRGEVFEPLATLLDEQDASSLQAVNLFVNNVPYNLEYYVVLTYDEPTEAEIDEMMKRLSSTSAVYRPDLTDSTIFDKLGDRRFDMMSLADRNSLVFAYANLFNFSKKADLINKGYNCFAPLKVKPPIFLSHQSSDKDEIERLIPYLNGKNLSVWFDKFNIDYGQSITKEVARGVKDSGAVIFWVSNKFLESNWCDRELQTFLNKYISQENFLVLTVLQSDVDEKLYNDKFYLIGDLKYIKREPGESIESVATKILPTLQNFFNK